MPKFTFTCEHEDIFVKDKVVSKITYESERDFLCDVLEDFRDFLKGAGFEVGDLGEISEDDDVDLSDIIIDTSSMNDSISITTGSTGDFSYDINRTS